MKIIIQILLYTFAIAVLTYDYYNKNEFFIEANVTGTFAVLLFTRSILLFNFKFKKKNLIEKLLAIIIFLVSLFGFYTIWISILGYGFSGKIPSLIFKLSVFVNVSLFAISAFDLLGLNRVSRKSV
ncbi:MAG: hypothetical protein ABF294_01170 [Flavobacteriales bacterium]|nr:hypothetical protein [Flavobacteriales bacterium]